MRDQIAAITQSLSAAPSFLYGTEKELNVLADSTAFPCVLLYPLQPIVVSPQVNGSVSNLYTMYLEFLYQTEFGQYTAANEAYVQQALHMANEFVVKAARYRDGPGRYFRVKAGQKAQCQPVYNKFDVNTTGAGLTLTISTMYFEKF